MSVSKGNSRVGGLSARGGRFNLPFGNGGRVNDAPFAIPGPLNQAGNRAMDALPDGGDIHFTTLVVGNPDQNGSPSRVRIEIEDNGIGIPEEHMPSIFDPFFSTKEMGTGLGLPLSVGIIENHSGRMDVTPGDERGVKVTIDLPLNAGAKPGAA